MKMGLICYGIFAGLLLIKTIGLCAGVEGIVKCGDSLGCCAAIYGLVWVICGSIWRWGEYGTVLADRDGTGGLDGSGEHEPGDGYMPKSGKFMNIFIIIYYSLLALPCACIIPLCLCMCCAAAVAK